MTSTPSSSCSSAEILQPDMACDARALLSVLSEREKFVVLSRVVEGALFVEIGRELGLSGTRAYQLYSRGMRKMRSSARRGCVTFIYYFNGLCYLRGDYFPGEQRCCFDCTLQRREQVLTP